MTLRTSKPLSALLTLALTGCGAQVVGWPLDTDPSDVEAPVVIDTSPMDLAISVNANTAVVVTFSEVMDPNTLSPSTFTLSNGAAMTQGVVRSLGDAAVLYPANALEPGTEYLGRITTGATDLAGNPMASDYTWSFTTWEFIDDTAPTVLETSPLDLANNVPLDTSVIATFSEPMDPTTLTAASFLLLDGTLVADGIVTSLGDTTVLYPKATLAPGTEYLARITSAAADLAGNTLATPYTWQFTTQSFPDLTPPTVTFTDPDDGDTNVDVAAVAFAVFSEAMNPLTVNATTFTVTDGGAPKTGVVTSLGDNALFSPTSPLDYDTLYTARIDGAAADLAGNPMGSAYTWTFTTAPYVDLLPPTVIFTDPSDGAVDVAFDVIVLATFSEAMDLATLNATSVTLEGATAMISGVVSPFGSTVVFYPDVALDDDTEYLATITTAAKDLDGNALAADYLWTFTTGLDLTAPSVILTDPVSDELDVPVDSVVIGTFDEDMDPLSLDDTSFLLSDGTSSITGIVTYDDVTRTTTFVPDVELSPETTYTATITTDATDLAGNGLALDYVWSFTTAAEASVWVPVDLGSLSTFVVAAGAGLTNSNSSGITTLGGDVALYPTGTCLGDGVTCSLLNPVITGTLYAADAAGIAAAAKVDLTAAYVDAMGRPPGTVVNDLSGLTLAPGVYTSGSTMSIAVGDYVVLDGEGDKDAVWVFQIGSSLTVNNDAQVLLVNGAQAKNVFWAAFASSTLGSDVEFQGSILAGASNSVGTDSTVVGRLLCTTGQVTLLSNAVTLPPI